MPWLTAEKELRTKMSDGDTDRLRAYKRVFGPINGVNTRFKTFEYRRITDFTDPANDNTSLGVYINQIKILAAGVTLDEYPSGYFTLSAPPVDGDVVEATYFQQHFTDEEIIEFLSISARWIGLPDPLNMPIGLQPPCLMYASAEAYQKLALKFADHMSEIYRLEDMPDPERLKLISEFKDAEKQARDRAFQLRDDFYKEQGRALAPLFGTALGHVRNVVPNR